MKYSSKDIDELIEWLYSEESEKAFREELKKLKPIVDSAKKAEILDIEALDVVVDI